MLNLDDGPGILTFSILTRKKVKKNKKKYGVPVRFIAWRAREVHHMARP